MREQIATSHTVPEFRAAVEFLRTSFQPYHDGELLYDAHTVDGDAGGNDSNEKKQDYNLYLPPWICQPYIRMRPDDHIALLAAKQRIADDPERIKQEYFDSDGHQISRKRMKKLRRASRKPGAVNVLRSKHERPFQLCRRRQEPCLNPMVDHTISINILHRPILVCNNKINIQFLFVSGTEMSTQSV